MGEQKDSYTSLLYVSEVTLERLKARDRETQEAVWKSERAAIEAVARSILKSESDAEQLVSDLFTDFFFHHVDTVRESRSIPAYLRIMARRRSVRFRERVLKLVPLEPGDDAPVSMADPERSIDDRRFLDRLRVCFGRLRPRVQKILKLHYGHEMSYSNIASNLGNSKQAVGKTVQKGLKALGECLEERGAARLGEG